jgi:NADH-quinone oxidoreductase subunit N
VIGVLTAVVAAFFYLRIVVSLFSTPDTEPARADAGLRVDGWSAAVLTVAAAVVVYAGILPGAWLDFAKDATFQL